MMMRARVGKRNCACTAVVHIGVYGKLDDFSTISEHASSLQSYLLVYTFLSFHKQSYTHSLIWKRSNRKWRV